MLSAALLYTHFILGCSLPVSLPFVVKNCGGRQPESIIIINTSLPYIDSISVWTLPQDYIIYPLVNIVQKICCFIQLFFLKIKVSIWIICRAFIKEFWLGVWKSLGQNLNVLGNHWFQIWMFFYLNLFKLIIWIIN